jgi:tetratricopeptide (TPR) repeat protein
MKPPLLVFLIVISFFALGQGACKRKKPVNVNADAVAHGGHTAEENRTQARALLEEGKELYRTDQDEKAVEAFQQAIKLDPELAEAHFRLGLAYDAVGQEQEAEEAYKKAIAVYKKHVDDNDKDAEAHYNMGQAYAGLHLYTEAIREYRQATRLKDDDADIFYDLGTALTKLAQYDEAVAAFSKSLEIDPENYRAEDGLEEAREGVKRIRAGKKHQEDLFKKQQKEEELKNANGESQQSNTSGTSSKSNSNANSKPKPRRKPVGEQ